jgi:hypothetical protein
LASYLFFCGQLERKFVALCWHTFLPVLSIPWSINGPIHILSHRTTPINTIFESKGNTITISTGYTPRQALPPFDQFDVFNDFNDLQFWAMHSLQSIVFSYYNEMVIDTNNNKDRQWLL